MFSPLLKRARASVLAALLSTSLAGAAQAQCPVAANCTPADGQFAGQGLGIGITRVSLNALNNITTADNTYEDYSCTQGATMTLGAPYTLTVLTGSSGPENVRVWIDYDNNGILNPTTELVLTSNNASTHAITNLRAPATAVLNTPLRMRVASDLAIQPNPTPCAPSVLGQIEDYAVTVVGTTTTPTADFTAGADTLTCSGLVQFQDLSQGSPTSWLWRFGDGQTSTQSAPQHQYTTPGTYSVTLVVANAQGTDSLVRANYISYDNRLPVAASCTPSNTQFCCNAGITRVRFANQIDVTSANGSVGGYQDFTCRGRAQVVAGNLYPISITTSGSPTYNIRVWLDADNDGQFASSELLYTSLNQPGGTTVTGQVFLPATLTTAAALRLRVMADDASVNFGPCTNLTVGQAEDYTLLVIANTQAPVANFGMDARSACDTLVQFRDSSQFAPTSWLWRFGDGQTSTLQNPSHVYHQTGLYTVTLVVTNGFGTDSVVRPNAVAITVPCRTYCLPTNLQTQSVWISQVQFAGINNTSGLTPTAYTAYTNQFGYVTQGQAQTLTLGITRQSMMGPPQTAFAVWIDYNQNGTWETGERVTQGQTMGPNPTVTRTFTIPASARLGATGMRVLATFNQGLTQSACPPDGAQGVEIEDYTIIIQPQQAIPVADFSATPQITCDGLVQFTDLSSNAPISWLWRFGDGQTSTQSNPQHQYSTATAATYTVTLIASNGFGLDSVVRTAYINVTGQAVPQAATCQPASTQPSFGLGIASVRLNTLVNNSNTATDGYRDYTCTRRTTLTKGNVYTITVNNIQSNGAHVRAWIDYNNDAAFDTIAELVLASDAGGNHVNTFTVPLTATGNVPLRMRVGSDWVQNPPPRPCTPVQYGQFEDYTIVLDSVTATPAFRTPLALHLLPNPAPAGGRALVRLAGDGAAGAIAVTVRTVLGQVAHRVTLNLSAATPEAALELGALPRGVYIVTFDGPTAALRGTTRLVLD